MQNKINSTGSTTSLTNSSSKELLKNMKNETATELGLANYNSTDKGNLTSRQNGYVGGYMTKKLVQYAEEHMKNSQMQ
ncbi:MAG: alpha/beta-type small acid-soluble spore protein [Peptococcaceae bacterium]|nr:alpha/beta-type small acid-soluble spore protein [Peptococcaceae bacterium]